MTKRLLFCSAMMLAPIAWGEEGASGHYFPGSISSFVDGVPAEEALITRLNILSYSGSSGSDLKLPIAGLAAVDVDVDSSALRIAAGLTHTIGLYTSIEKPFMAVRLKYLQATHKDKGS